MQRTWTDHQILKEVPLPPGKLTTTTQHLGSSFWTCLPGLLLWPPPLSNGQRGMVIYPSSCSITVNNFTTISHGLPWILLVSPWKSHSYFLERHLCLPIPPSSPKLSRTVKGLKCYPTCKLTIYPPRVAEMLVGDLKLQARDERQYIT